MKNHGNKADLSKILVIASLAGFMFIVASCSKSSFIKSNELLVANGQSEKAVDNYRNALTTDSKNHELYFYLAKTLYTAGNYSQAEVEINKALILEPQIDLYRLLAGKIAFALMDYFNATNHLINALLLNNTNLEAYYYLALTYQKTGNSEQALAQLDTAIALEPLYFNVQYLWYSIKFNELTTDSSENEEKTGTNSETKTNRIVSETVTIEQSIGDLIVSFSEVLKTNPRSVEGTILLSKMYSAIGESGQSQNLLSSWVKQFGDESEAVIFELAKQKYDNGLFNEALMVLDKIKKPSVESQILRLRLLHRTNPKSDYEPELRQLLKENNDSVDILLFAAQLELEKGRVIEAESLLNACIDKNPEFAGCYYSLSEVLTIQKDDFGSQWALEKAFGLSPFDNEIRLKYARRLIENSRFNEAEKVLGHISNKSNDPQVAFLNGKLAKERKDYSKAETLFKFARKYIYAVEIEAEFADMEILQGKFKQAERRLLKIESVAPGHLEIALEKALLYNATNRSDLVPDILTSQLLAPAGRGRVHLLLADINARSRNLKKSMEILEQGLRIWPRNLELTQAITFYMGLTEQYGRAIELLEDIQAYNHKYNRLFQYRLWMYYFKSGNTEKFNEYRIQNN